MSHKNILSPTDGLKALKTLDLRRSVPPMQLGEPGPDEPTLMRMLSSAVRVPDHGRRVPFRFIAISGDARHELGHKLALRSREVHPDASEAVIDKDRARFSHAPLVIAVIARLGPDEKIPEQERLLSAGCVCFALLQAAQALGFGACWLTGWSAYDPMVRGWLGLIEHEHVAGYIHIGTVKIEKPERERPDPRELLTHWSPT